MPVLPQVFDTLSQPGPAPTPAGRGANPGNPFATAPATAGATLNNQGTGPGAGGHASMRVTGPADACTGQSVALRADLQLPT